MNRSRSGNIASFIEVTLCAVTFAIVVSALSPSVSSARLHPPVQYFTDGGGDEFPEGIALPVDGDLSGRGIGTDQASRSGESSGGVAAIEVSPTPTAGEETIKAGLGSWLLIQLWVLQL